MQIGAGPFKRFLSGLIGYQFGVLLELANQVNEGFNQVVIDLPEPVQGEAQQVEPCGSLVHALQLVEGVKLDERRIVLAAFV